jgi:hypothetical protein
VELPEIELQLDPIAMMELAILSEQVSHNT